jgi:hypothetical protein
VRKTNRFTVLFALTQRLFDSGGGPQFLAHEHARQLLN